MSIATDGQSLDATVFSEPSTMPSLSSLGGAAGRDRAVGKPAAPCDASEIPKTMTLPNPGRLVVGPSGADFGGCLTRWWTLRGGQAHRR